MENTYNNMQKKYMKLLNSYRKKKEKLTVFDINFLLQDLIDKDQITFCGNNGKLEKKKYNINLINLTDPKKYEQSIKDNKNFNFRIAFRLNDEKDFYNGDEVINRLKKYI
jgi:hypothetical protein